MGAHAHQITILLGVLPVLLHYLGVDAVGNHVPHGGIGAELLHYLLGLLEINRRKELAGTAGDGLFALEYDLLEIHREAAGGLAHHALEVADHGIREGQMLAFFHNILRGQVVLYHKDRQVAHHLGGRSHLYQVAQHIVDLLVHLLDFQEAAAQAQRDDLRLQVGVLAAGDLVAIDIGNGGLEAVIEARVAQADVGPVIGELLNAFHGEASVSGVALEGCHNGVHRRLRSQAGHGGHSGIHNIHAGLGSHQQGCNLVAGGIVGMEMNRDADLLLQGVYQLFGRIGLEQTGHILDADGVCADVLQLLGQLHIVIQGVAGAGLVHNVTGVADGCLAELILLQHLIHGNGHTGHPVQGIEHTEDVDAAQRGLLDKLPDNVIGIVLIAHGVGATEQHLERDVGDLFPEQIQPFPGILMQEPVGNVEGCAAPHLQREAIRQDIRRAVCTLDHVAGTHSGGQQGLMGVPHGGIGNQQLLLIHDPLGQCLGALFVQQLL